MASFPSREAMQRAAWKQVGTCIGKYMDMDMGMCIGKYMGKYMGEQVVRAGVQVRW